MKKILIAFDGANFSDGAFRLAAHLHQLQPFLLTGIFIPQADFAHLWTYASEDDQGTVIPLSKDPREQQRLANEERFEKLCREKNIHYSIHKDYYGFAMEELRQETRYADLLLIGDESFYQNIREGKEDYLKETLYNAECPVLLVPEKFRVPNNLIFAYDGTPASVYALKQFAYLFPSLTQLPAMLVYTHEEEQLPEKQNIDELARVHFPNVRLFRLDTDPANFSIWLQDKRESLLVCGAYGRSPLSQLFHKSFIEDVIHHHRLPVFIAHK